MEALAVTAPEGAAKDATASQDEVEAVEKAEATGEMEIPEGAGPCGKAITPERAAAGQVEAEAAMVVVEVSEDLEGERVAEAFARAAERIAKSEVAKVLQSAIAELKEKEERMAKAEEQLSTGGEGMGKRW
ncbi:uncharacterized protein LOC112970750 [Apteryx rowi]|uniref:uncharacterized protein LOC112970750 n=1 Tax=Apteryx rowi TaxID=308060 RepID=UPI000E1D52F2|nr:uncharacterized protein LOC112970750 [Apteryx rowi]